MATHDYVIANQGFPAFRSDLNDALAAIVSNNSSATEPTTMFAHMIWVDTAANPSILKMRNADNDAWVTLGRIDQTNDRFILVGPQYFNRLSTDGDVAIIQKDGTTVGSIGSSSGQAFIGGTAKGIRFSTLGFTGTDNTGALSDGAIDIGTSSHRIKDLYLSGSVYLGGTGAANALDDYEEGTFTPTVTAGTVSTSYGYYIKIGAQVHVRGVIAGFSNTSSSSTIAVNNLPFTANSTAGDGTGGSCFASYNTAGPVSSYVSSNTTEIAFFNTKATNANYAAVRYLDLTSGSAAIYFEATYFVN